MKLKHFLKVVVAVHIGTLIGFTLAYLSEFYQIPTAVDIIFIASCVAYMLYRIIKSYKKFSRELDHELPFL